MNRSPSTRRLLGRAAAALAVACACAGALAQGAWPNKPVRVIVPYAAGSSPDVIMRIVAERLAPRLGQPVTVENRAGAGGNNGTGVVAKAPGDGYTFLISTNGPLVYSTVFNPKLPYDPFKDLRPLYGLAINPVAFAVRADSPYKTINDVVAAAKKDGKPLQHDTLGMDLLHFAPVKAYGMEKIF